MARASTPSDLTDHLGYWLRFVSNHVSLSFARKVEEAGVTVAEWVLLRQLFDVDACAPSRLADRMGMTRGAISKLADRLLAKSLLLRTADPDDGRAHTLALTQKGRVLVPRLAALADRNDAQFFGRTPVADRAALLRILKEIVKQQGLESVPVD